MNPLIFREYDIRGIVDKDLTDEVVRKIGCAFGTYLQRLDKRDITIGGDCRLSTERFRKVLIHALTDTGCTVTDLGVCTSPILYFSIVHLKKDGGLMITGSHNPRDFNGFKLCVGEHTLHGDEIQEILRIIENGTFAAGNGSTSAYDIVTDYQNYLCEQFTFQKKLAIAVDAGNGTAGEVIVPILERLRVDVTPLNCTMDGNFPVHHPDPTIPENLEQLIATVREKKLDFGIAFDGDGDRIGTVNDKGEIIWADKLMILYTRDILKKNPGATFISEVKCSKLFYEDVERHGGTAIMWKAGHSLIKAKMKEVKAAMAGEVSGHIFFADRYFGFDDAIYAALRLIEIVAAADTSLSELLNDVPQTFVTPELRIACPDERKFAVVDAIKKEFKKSYQTIDIDGVRVIFDDGWGLVRPSNTQAELTMRFEATTQKRLEEIKSLVEATVKEVMERVI
ncbi:MAG: phosphomannomutase/phosphoglucomutase [Candidatus Omnitrophica bacterium]|nr:phosphomannomutase/phosphoglucomutase [Candidatus Omnitrophota bacterium]